MRASTAQDDPPGLLVRSARAVRTWVSAKKRRIFQRNAPAVAPLDADDGVWHSSGDLWAPDGKELQVFFDRGLGDGTYGQVFTGVVSGGPHKGEFVIVKRAKDGNLTPAEMRGEVGEVTPTLRLRVHAVVWVIARLVRSVKVSGLQAGGLIPATTWQVSCPRRVIGELSEEDEKEILEISPAYLQVRCAVRFGFANAAGFGVHGSWFWAHSSECTCHRCRVQLATEQARPSI